MFKYVYCVLEKLEARHLSFLEPRTEYLIKLKTILIFCGHTQIIILIFFTELYPVG